MASQVVTVTSGVVASPVFALDPGNRALAILCPSYGTATLFQVQFGAAIDASTLSFGPVAKGDGTGASAVFSITPGGPIWAVVQNPPTPYARLVLNPAATITFSCTVVPVLR